MLTGIENSLFLTLSLPAVSKITARNVSVKYKTQTCTHNFTLGKDYLPATVVVNPSAGAVYVETKSKSYTLQNNSVLFVEENEEFLINHNGRDNSGILLLLLGSRSQGLIPENKILQNESFLSNVSDFFIRNYDKFKDDTLYQKQLECNFSDRLKQIKYENIRKINNLNFRKHSTRNENFRRILRSVEFMNDSLNGEITLEKLAVSANLSKYHYLRLFKNIYNVTPLEYLSIRRVLKAKELLKETDLSITDISYGLGFKNLSHLSFEFRKRTGITMREFRLSEQKKQYHINDTEQF